MAPTTSSLRPSGNRIKPFNLLGSALAATAFTEVLQQIPAERVLVMIDSCHAEGMATSKEAGLALEVPTGGCIL